MMKIGVIGCGAVTEILHLPALLERTDIRLSAAVDKNLDRANLIAAKSSARAFSSIEAALPEMDTAIVALPHGLHCEATVKLLKAGKHVLVEKPMAPTLRECDEMIAASRKSGATLAIGQMRRFCPALVATKCFLDRGILGPIQSFSILEGGVFAWPVASDYLLRKETAGGGVLVDTGAHTFDTILWLFGDVTALDYRDDAYGGVEADCEVRMTMASGAKGYVELSRTRNLPADLVIVGEHGRIVVNYAKNQLDLELDGKQLDTCKMETKDAQGREIGVWGLMIRRQLENWVDSLSGKSTACVPGPEGRRVVGFFEECYRTRRLLEFPWVQSPAASIKL
jgi:predicted dehydrogenase